MRKSRSSASQSPEGVVPTGSQQAKTRLRQLLESNRANGTSNPLSHLDEGSLDLLAQIIEEGQAIEDAQAQNQAQSSGSAPIQSSSRFSLKNYFSRSSKPKDSAVSSDSGADLSSTQEQSQVNQETAATAAIEQGNGQDQGKAPEKSKSRFRFFRSRNEQAEQAKQAEQAAQAEPVEPASAAQCPQNFDQSSTSSQTQANAEAQVSTSSIPKIYPVVVYTPQELEQAQQAGAERIIVKGPLASKLSAAMKCLRTIGVPSYNTLALILSGAALLSPFTGGVTVMGTLGAAITAAAIAAISAIGLSLVIAVLKGYDEVKLGGGGVELVIKKKKDPKQESDTVSVGTDDADTASTGSSSK